jgi:acetyl-CoA acyltransferase
VINTLGLDPSKVNPMGGAIAWATPGCDGRYPVGDSRARLQRKNLKYGMVTMCVGMGQGAAGIFERVYDAPP